MVYSSEARVRMRKRRQNFQNIGWFLDLHKRGFLDLDPPFQRRSVWPPLYREQFIDTILLDYPAPAIFLFPKTDEAGVTKYDLVDGKQRLTTIFAFINGVFPVGDSSEVGSLRGKYFQSLASDVKVAFFEYDFSVEYLPTNDEQVINNIFNRLNKNVAKLTPQELRHAKYNGKFIAAAETLAEWMQGMFTKKFPRIPESSRRQMKDVEMTATLLLFLEDGTKSTSVDTLDEAFASRDHDWESEHATQNEFRRVIEKIADLVNNDESLAATRLRNQADFYSLFGAFAQLIREKALPADLTVLNQRIRLFLESLENEDERQESVMLGRYWDASRTSTSDAGPRDIRIKVMKKVLKGEPLNGEIA